MGNVFCPPAKYTPENFTQDQSEEDPFFPSLQRANSVGDSQILRLATRRLDPSLPVIQEEKEDQEDLTSSQLIQKYSKEFEALREKWTDRIRDEQLIFVKSAVLQLADRTLSFSGYKNQVTNKITGPGIGEFSDGTLYVGEWEDGYYQGEGLLTLGSENYKGQFKQNKFNGKGKMQLNEDEFQEGDWVDSSLVHGTIVYRVQNGAEGLHTYRGPMVNNLFDGEGSLTFPEGSSY